MVGFPLFDQSELLLNDQKTSATIQFVPKRSSFGYYHVDLLLNFWPPRSNTFPHRLTRANPGGPH